MYWTMWGDEPQLLRANLDGTQRKVLITGLGRVQDLTIDYIDRRLYWIDIDHYTIQSSDLLGEYFVFVCRFLSCNMIYFKSVFP